MRKFNFEKKKLGFELFKDLHKYENQESTLSPTIHIGNFFEILFFEKVDGSLDLNGQTVKIQSNSAFFIAPYQKKSMEFDSSKIKAYHLIFHKNFFSEIFKDQLFAYRMHYFFNSQYPQFLQLPYNDFEFVNNILNELSKELADFKNDSEQIIRSLLYFIFIKLNRLYSKQYNLPSATQGDKYIYKFKEALEQNFRKFHLVDDYCDILSIQRHRLNRIVKTHFGLTAKETIHFRILKEIKLELMYSEKSIAEIASELNFSEANNLTRFFNRLEGIPPTLFRENYRDNRL